MMVNRSLRAAFLRPTVLAAIVVALAAVFTALMSVLTNSITASYQSASDREKSKTAVLLSILQEYNTGMVPGRNEQMMKDRITIAIQSGLISDEDGSICLAFLKQGCPVKVLRVK
jgi:hypothetical protein